ncbi:MAG: lytic transglycosylase domain-containing protein [Bacteroidota bacterium]
MSSIKTKLIYFIVPFLLLAGAVALVGSVKNVNRDRLKGLSTQATTVSLDPPNDMNFAGEIVPLRDFDVKERMDKELIRYIYYHSATIMNIKRAARWKPEISSILKKQGIPEDFFYLAVAESHLTNATSPVGAKGFWQFMPATAKMYGLEVSKQVDERYDPIKSTYAACDYLKDAHRMFRNWTLVAASYNMGMGGVKKQLTRQKVDNYYDLYLNRETAAYVFRILALKTILENPEAYGFKLRKEQLYRPLRYKIVKVDSTIDDLVTWALDHGTTYKMLKVLNPWLLKDKIAVAPAPEGESPKVYAIKVPRDASLEESDLGTELIPDSAAIGVQDSAVVDSAAVPAEEAVPVTLDSAATDSLAVPQPVASPTDSTEAKAKKKKKKRKED